MGRQAGALAWLVEFPVWRLLLATEICVVDRRSFQGDAPPVRLRSAVGGAWLGEAVERAWDLEVFVNADEMWGRGGKREGDGGRRSSQRIVSRHFVASFVVDC